MQYTYLISTGGTRYSCYIVKLLKPKSNCDLKLTSGQYICGAVLVLDSGASGCYLGIPNLQNITPYIKK